MQLLSVNVSLPREVIWQGRHVITGIFKQPLTGRVRVNKTNIDGDAQADLRVHGGPDKAVYAYPVEHYAYWERVLRRGPFDYGQFGENLTVQGLTEDDVCIGDTYRVGTTLLQVSQPRTPCFKLDLKMGIDGFRATFLKSQRTGFYFRVLERGEIGAGDAIERIARSMERVSVQAAFAQRHGLARDRLSG